MVAIMRNLFSQDVMGVKTAAASAAALSDFIGREVSVFCTKYATVDVIIKGLRTMRDMSLPMLSLSAEEAPEGLMEALAAMIAKRGGGPQNLH
jgi:Asp/Glu/hydantoin racemase